jgi:energy-coupling factor transporter transmembrane protein EcfT
MLTDNPDVNVLGVIFLLILFFYSKIPLSILKFYTTIMLNILWIIIIAYTFFGGYSPSYTVIAN